MSFTSPDCQQTGSDPETGGGHQWKTSLVSRITCRAWEPVLLLILPALRDRHGGAWPGQAGERQA